MPSQTMNKAAWQPAKKALALEVKAAPYTTAPANGLVIKNHAIAVNPIDWLIQRKGDVMFGWLEYPFVLGSDVSGEVVEVGKDIKRFKVGDRVLGFSLGTNKQVNSSSQGAFQNYTVLLSDLTCQIPSFVSYESAAVIPLGLSTASAGLFQDDLLALQLPTVPPKPTGRTLLVWGGSTSVGCNAVQLAVAAGYEVYTTSSPKNFDYLKKLGASKVFDYKSKSVIKDLIRAFQGRRAAGALAIGTGGAEGCMSVLEKVEGNKFVSLATFPVSQEEDNGSFLFLRTAVGFVTWTLSYKFRGAIKGIKSNYVSVANISTNGIARSIYVDFLPNALDTGAFIPAPDTIVAGEGLESIQTAFEVQQKGVSAKKVVVRI